MQPKKLKRAVIKEELVVLTGGYISALILNQFIYWSERVRDATYFMKEELDKLETDIGEDLSIEHGWIYKTASDLAEELMIEVSPQTVGRHLERLVDKWLDRRRNPRTNRDRTYQYRVNLVQIQYDLMALGYVLDGYPITAQLHEAILVNLKPPISKMENASLSDGSSNFQNGSSPNFQNGNSNFQNGKALPETTTETTTETTNLSLPQDGKEGKTRKKSDFDLIRVELEKRFSELPGDGRILPVPKNKRELNVRWHTPLLEMYGWFKPRENGKTWKYDGEAIGEVCLFMSYVYQDMKSPKPGIPAGLTVDSPHSMLRTARSAFPLYRINPEIDISAEFAKLNGGG